METSSSAFECAFPIKQYPFITMAHGAGGQLTQQLLEKIFRPAFNNPLLEQQHDSALLKLPGQAIAVTTDSYVVSPLFFPGSDIGELAVTGTVNDLAMSGARPLYLTCAFILTEGLSTQTLIQVVAKIREAALKNNVQIIAGDIKVVEKTADQSLYINTTGIGILSQHDIRPQRIQVGDAIIISGDIGRHGLAVLAARGKLDFEPPITSDCAPLWPMVSCLLENNCPPHCLRDLTRGGLVGALLELAQTTALQFEIEQNQIPLSQAVHAGCEILGLDPLYIANEGRMILFTPEKQIDATLRLLHAFSEGNRACCIGRVTAQKKSGEVISKTAFGSETYLQLFRGEQLPRIC